MKTRCAVWIAIAASSISALAQNYPGAPDGNGLTPKTSTIYVNSQGTDSTTINNGNSEAIGVAIAGNGNVIVGWEDDNNDYPTIDLESAWTMYNSSGVQVTTNQTLTSVNDSSITLDTRFLSLFRSDGSGVYDGTSWGPKIKANLFGGGVGMGCSSFFISDEVSEFADYDTSMTGDLPVVQLLSNAGQPSGILAGASVAYATRDGDIWIADWDYLSDGNILIMAESHQFDDLVSVYGGATDAVHAFFRILAPDGTVVKNETLVSSTVEQVQMWHGVGVVNGGFAARFATSSGDKVRLFKNDGTPITTNINLATVTGLPMAGTGGQGENTGFHGNGLNAYVVANAGLDAAGSPAVCVTVLNTNGTVRYSKSVVDDITLLSADSADAAINTNGEVIVVFTGTYYDNPNTVMGRKLDASGNTTNGTFYVSENEYPKSGSGAASYPRVAWRDGKVAISWVSTSDPGSIAIDGSRLKVAALRLFSTSTNDIPTTARPTLSAKVSGKNITLSWDASATGFTLVSTTNISSNTIWTTVGTQNPTTEAMGTEKKFYRLVK